MCGIVGYVHVEGAGAGADVLARMMHVIRHRGPDASGVYTDSQACLGHLRLSIVDLVTGQQPMANEDRTLWITYNGEMFNHADLRPELEARGHRYHSRSDTETILHAFEEYGESCVERFRGMFSFAIWDASRRRLFVARDRLGIKPFYYFWNGRVFGFSSEIKALLEHPAVSTAPCEEALSEYLAFGFLNDERTMFSGIRRLMPGHTLTLDLGDATPVPTLRQYWDVPVPNEGPEQDDAAWVRDCRSRLEESVRLRLMSDVPLGMFLSGGLDSSLIAALMTRMVTEPIKTFSVGYREAPFSELNYAKRVAQHLGTDHHEVTIGTEDFFSALPLLTWHEDEPIFWPSSVPLYFVSKLARQHVTVVLTGEGSDELLAGYDRYAYYLLNRRAMNFYGWLPESLRRAVRRQISDGRWLSGRIRNKLGHTWLAREDRFDSLQLDNFYCAFSKADLGRVGKGSASDGQPYANYLRYFNAHSHRSVLRRMLYADLKTYLVELLMKQDQMSMATSIESRVPFLDHPFVEFAMRIPERLKISGLSGKVILKRAAEGLIPEDIINRKKMGFPTPFHRWVHGPNADELFRKLLDRNGFVAEHTTRQGLEQMFADHRSGKLDATDRIWRLLALQVWGDVFILRREPVLEQVLAGSAAS
jgi:asparagine synthase (glutamine-hydrolysing)